MPNSHIYEIVFQYEDGNIVTIRFRHDRRVPLIDIPDLLIEKNLINEDALDHINDVRYIGAYDENVTYPTEEDGNEPIEIKAGFVQCDQALLTPTEKSSTTSQFNKLCRENNLMNSDEYVFFFDGECKVTENEITIVILPKKIFNYCNYAGFVGSDEKLSKMRQYDNYKSVSAMLSLHSHLPATVNFLSTEKITEIMEESKKEHPDTDIAFTKTSFNENSGDEITEQEKVLDLMQQGYTLGQIAEMGLDNTKIYKNNDQKKLINTMYGSTLLNTIGDSFKNYIDTDSVGTKSVNDRLSLGIRMLINSLKDIVNEKDNDISLAITVSKENITGERDISINLNFKNI